MTTFSNRDRLRDRARHFDLLAQAADSAEEEAAVRKALSRAGACRGPCDQGRSPCPCPDACLFPDAAPDQRVTAERAITWAVVLVCAGLVALLLVNAAARIFS